MSDPEFDRALDLAKRKLGAREVATDLDDLDALLASREWVKWWNEGADNTTVVNPHRGHDDDD